MKGPKVSILIAAYNRRRVIEQALASAFGQSYRNIEVVVYDDGSTDETHKIIRPYKKVKYYRRAKNRGVGNARNALLSMASGEYGCWLDSDDLSNRWRVELQLAVLLKYRATFMRTAFRIFCWNYNPNIWKERPEYKTKRQFCCATSMFRIDMARKVKYPIDLLLGEDIVWEKRFIARHGPGMMLPLSLYHVGRGKKLGRLSQAHRDVDLTRRYRQSMTRRDDMVIALMKEMKSRGVNGGRFVARVPREECEAMLKGLK